MFNVFKVISKISSIFYEASLNEVLGTAKYQHEPEPIQPLTPGEEWRERERERERERKRKREHQQIELIISQVQRQII